MCKTTVFKRIISFSVVNLKDAYNVTAKQLFVYMAIARMNAVLDTCYRYIYLARLHTGKTADCSIWSDRKDLHFVLCRKKVDLFLFFPNGYMYNSIQLDLSML